jgi:hypothetical protein
MMIRLGRPAMLNRKVIWIALAIYAGVLGFVMMPTDRLVEAHARPGRAEAGGVEGLPFCGVALQLHRDDWLDKYRKCIDEIADTGADTVSFEFFAWQEDKYSEQIFLDPHDTFSQNDLQDLVGRAKQHKLRVIFMPIVLLRPPTDPLSNDWRGVIAPKDWGQWFDSYRSMLGYYAKIADTTGADVFVVGSEMISSETHIDEWNKTIDQVRGQFHGYLTYSSNWDHYRSVKFWDHLDLIGMNSYWTLGKDRHASVQEIKDRWGKIQDDLFEWQQTQGKPIVLLEVGWFSMGNAIYEPWDYTKADKEPTDLDAQRRLYEGFFESWWGKPELGGFMMWEWSPDLDPAQKDYTPQGKPAEQVLRQWLAKPRWKVEP